MGLGGWLAGFGWVCIDRRWGMRCMSMFEA